MNRLRKLRVVVASLFLLAVTLLFLDFTGTIHSLLGWVAKVQFIPALLGVHLGVVIVLVVLTLLFGRLYCSVICPLGVFQDVVNRFASLRKNRKFSYSPAMSWLRYGVLTVFVLAIVAGVGSVVALLEPYSAFGRISSNLFAPIYKLGNNVLAYFAERADSYTFYTMPIFIKSIGVFVVSIATLAGVSFLAWRSGRTYCNTICPVGTILGFISKFSLYKIQIDTDKCNGCRKCVRECKASCIDAKEHTIDYSRCVSCYDCIDSCSTGAISYTRRKKAQAQSEQSKKTVDTARRSMLTISATMVAGSVVKAQEKLVDGGLAIIEDKKIPNRSTRIVPPGALSIRNFAQKCTGCQLCVSVCPNDVLRPSSGLMNFMQPEMSYEIGYCRPECNMCSSVCPAGAITKIDVADKASTQIGHAVLIEKNCVVLTDGAHCGNCAVHCPVGAITMVKAKDEKYGGREIPVVNAERCIGCGACENLCPARPFSAIYVEGHNVHKAI